MRTPRTLPLAFLRNWAILSFVELVYHRRKLHRKQSNRKQLTLLFGRERLMIGKLVTDWALTFLAVLIHAAGTE